MLFCGCGGDHLVEPTEHRKCWIRKRARELNAEKELPENW
jgi:hypothetical protein